MRLKCIATILLCVFCQQKAAAAPDFETGKNYRIVCRQFPSGCVADGATIGQQSPLFYLTTATTDPEAYWIMEEAGGGLYYIRNAKTRQYVTYDGVREGSTRRYVSMTDTSNGNYSRWTFTHQDAGYFVIRNAGMTDHIWDVRVGSYVVGTYSNAGAGNSNQLFSFYDETGTAVEDVFSTGDPLSGIISSLTLGNCSPVYVKDGGGYYLQPIDLSHFGTDLPLTVSYTLHEGCGPLQIDGTVVESGETYTFSNVKGGSGYSLTATRADGSTQSIRLTFTSLPVVRLYGSFGNDYTQGKIAVQEPDAAQYEPQHMKAKWRGGITNGTDKHKRNYHIKFLTADGEKLEQKFFGLRNDNSWLLEACQVDMSRIRNRMITDLWNDYSTPPYYADMEPKARTGTRGRFVELVLNEEYRGIYCMTEAMDRKQMKLKKYDELTNTVYGQLWKSKDWSYAVFMGHYSNRNTYPATAPANFSNTSESWDQYYVKYPDIEDVYPTNWQPLWNAVNFVCTASDATFREQAATRFDMPLLIDYYILLETVLSTDNHGKNMYFAIYDKTADQRITFGIWDLDATMGQRWSDAYYHSSLMKPEQDYTAYITANEHGDYNLFRRMRLTNADDFNMQVRLRYRDLRNGYLATESIIERFEKQLSEFKTCGADQREYAKWNGDTDINRLTLNFDTEFEYLKTWITRRMNYLDNTRFDIASLPTSIEMLRNAEAAPVPTGKAYDLTGRPIPASGNYRGIKIVGGRKIFKR